MSSDEYNIPKTMRAVALTGHGGLEKLQYRTDWPVPQPNPDQVLLRVRACGVNNTDINTRLGWYSKDVTTAHGGSSIGGDWGGCGLNYPIIQGADVCGIVVVVGAKAPKNLLGKRVIVDTWLRDWNRDEETAPVPGYLGSEANGGFAEYCVVHHRNVGVIERTDLSDAELATFSCSYTTAEGMLSRANVKQQDRVLITGASGGVGTALIQLANRRGATTIAMASRSKHEQVAALKPNYLLDRSPENLASTLLQTTGSDKVDVVADIVAGPFFSKLLEQIRRRGHYVASGAIAGPIVELDMRTLYLQDLTLLGSTVVPPHVFRDLVGYINRGEIRPVLAATYPLEKLRDAQEAFVAKKHTGNIAIVP